MIGPADRCLIVEENFLIRQDLADMLQSLGVQNVDEAATIAEAMVLISTVKYRVVFLYMIYVDEGSLAVAGELKRQNVPFVITSGCLDANELPCAIKESRFISKPYSLEVIGSIIEGL